VLEKIVRDTTEKYEALMPRRGRSRYRTRTRADDEGDRGFTIEITRVEAKFKLGQNKSPEDRAGTVRGLEESGHLPSIELAHFTRAQLGL
jgi:predicted FMN-binding regulatory protein PaiB